MENVTETMKNYIKEAKMLLKSKDDPDKVVFNSAKSAKSFIEQEISKLKYELVVAERKLELAKETYHNAKFSAEWLRDPKLTLREIDQTESQLDACTQDIENLEYSIKKREKLLADYQEEIEK